MKKASHGVKDIVFRCLDYRFRAVVDQWIKDNLNDQADLMVWPGVSTGFTDAATAKQMIDVIKLAQRLHGITTVHVMNHRDCGGHGGSGKHVTPEAEQQYHEQELKKAAQIIIQALPDITVRTHFVDFDGVHQVKK